MNNPFISISFLFLIETSKRSFYKVMVLLCILAGSYNTKGQDISQIREDYFVALYDETTATELFEELTSTKSTDPLITVYKGGIYAVMCLHTANPFKRTKLIKKADLYINEAVKNKPNNTEIRFMRFAMQSQIPKFLGKSDNLAEDIAFLEQKLLVDDISYLDLDARLYVVKLLKDCKKVKRESVKKIEQRMLSVK